MEKTEPKPRKRYISVTDPEFERDDGSYYIKPTILRGQTTTTHIYDKSPIVIEKLNKKKPASK